MSQSVAVGTAVACRSPHSSVRAELPYTAPSCLGYVTRSDPRDTDVHFWGLGYRGRQGVRNATTEAGYSGCVA